MLVGRVFDWNLSVHRRIGAGADPILFCVLEWVTFCGAPSGSHRFGGPESTALCARHFPTKLLPIEVVVFAIS